MIDSPVGKTADAAVAGNAHADGRRRRRMSSRAAGRCSTAWARTSSTAAQLGAGQTMKLINNLLATGGVRGVDRGAGDRHRSRASRSTP